MSPSEQQPSQSFAPHEAAALVGMSVHSIRRWCEYHAAYLSVRANPAPGVQRRLTPRDVEVMKHIKSLRDDGISVNLINEQLAGLTFAEIDTDPSTAEHQLAQPPTQTGADAAPGMIVAPDYLMYLERRVDAVEQARREDKQQRRDRWWWWVAGLVCGLGLAAVAELFALLASRVR